LAQLGMVDRRKDGNTRRLSTTRRFSESFGCPHTDRKKVRAWFREQVQSSGLLDELGDRNEILRDASDEAGTVQAALPVSEEE